MTYTETDLVTTIEQLAGGDLAALTQPQVDGIDQFHSGGAEAVDRLLPSLGLTAGMTALDVGSGLGGPARQVARSTGAAVLGVDITQSYVDAATALTAAAGQSGRVEFVWADVDSVARSDFDAAYTMHVQMNVADKRAFFTAIARRVRPGARLATFEICRSGPDDPALPLPLPWSIDGTDSFLATSEELRATIEVSGFETIEWVDETAWVVQWFRERGARAAAAGSAATLPALLADGPTRMMNLAAALSEGTLSVHRGGFLRVS
jgi:sarcosine/dimethylglycine N-methyltransferase